MSALLLMLAGCSSDDENGGETISPSVQLADNTLLVSKDGDAVAESYPVTSSGFYIDAMPVEGSNGPSFIFHCSFDSPDVKELVFCIINLKKDADAFRVGEIFPSDQLNAILKPRKETEDYFYNSTQGSIKLMDKKKADGKDILTFELDELAFEGGYTINGRVDFEYGGTVY